MAGFDLVEYAPLIIGIIVGIISPLAVFFSKINMSNVTGMAKMETVQNDIAYIKRDMKESFTDTKELIREKELEWDRSTRTLIEKVEELSREQRLHEYKISQLLNDLRTLQNYRNGGAKAAI